MLRRFRLYDVEDASVASVEIGRALRALRVYPRQARKLRTRLAVLELISGADVGRRVDAEGEEYRSVARARLYLRAMRRRAVRRLREAGVAQVSIRAGSLHFYTMRGTEVVLLCWRLGEARVDVWHRADEPCRCRRRLPAGEHRDP